MLNDCSSPLSLLESRRSAKPRELTGPANERMLADRTVWQFPWYWSAGALGGLWLLSVLVLMTRIKSLDRLK